MGPIKHVSAGDTHSVVTDADGQVYVAGDTTWWGKPASHFQSLGITARSVSAGSQYFLIADADGTVWGAGLNHAGQLGLGSDDLISTALSMVCDSGNAASVAAGTTHSIMIDSQHTVWVAGADPARRRNTRTFQALHGVHATTAAVGENHSILLSPDGEVTVTGANSHGQLGQRSRWSRSRTIPKLRATQIAAGSNHSVILDTEGTAWVAGDNTYGQIGLVERTAHHCFTPIPGIDAVTVAAGSFFTAIIDAAGALWTAGSRGMGCSFGGFTRAKIPVPVAAVDVGQHHTIAADHNGDLWVTGANPHGQLGYRSSRLPNSDSRFTRIPTGDAYEILTTLQRDAEYDDIEELVRTSELLAR
jgi:alpha-tubulin suppressor-like RCC1 family protein